MCKQKTLTIAIASALMVGSGAVSAVDQFQNGYVGMTPTIHDSAAITPQPLEIFNFPSDITLIKGEQYGITYASELFGDGSSSVKLPSGANTASNIGAYAAVVYTIDGEISKKFDMTFTLTNGATFATAPSLSMDISEATDTKPTGANAVVNEGIDAGVSNIQVYQTGSVAPGASLVVQFSGSGQLYKAVGSGTDTTANYIEVTPFGSSTAGLTEKITASDASLVGVYYLSPFGTANTNYIADLAENSASDLDGNIITTALVVDGASYTARSTEFTVTEVGATDTIISAFPADGDGFDGAAGNEILRVYKAGDSNITVNFDVTAGIADNGPLAGAEDNPSNNIFQFASQSQKYEVLTSTGTPPADNHLLIDPVLDKAITEGDKLYQVKMKVAGDTIDQGVWTLPIEPVTSTGSGKSTVTFTLDAATTPLKDNTRVVMVYQLDKATALADAGQDIKMQVSLVTDVDGILVNPARELKIATSKQAVDASMKAMDIGQVRVSVDSGSTAFTGSSPGPYISATTAKIGYISIKPSTGTKAKTDDGQTDFVIGGTGAEASASTLDIEDGQFAASISDNGRIFINADSTIEASNVTETTAHWDLTNTNLDTIVGTTTDISDGKTTIQFTADGKAVINTGLENPPSATLVIDFDTPTTRDITLTSELSEIKQDGTICRLYNVPPSTALDFVNIRITNESTSSDDLVCTMVDTAGAIVLDGVNCFQDEFGASIPIKPMETKRLTSTMLEALGATWGGRAVLTIKSSLPKMEVFGMLRSSVPGSPLTNLSYGAHGKSCTQ